MDGKIKDTINQLIDEFGLYEAKNMLGITFANIVKLSGQKIYTDTGMASEILYESINNGQLPIKYKEFEISTNSDGVAYWEGKFKTDRFLPNMVETIWVMATPFWDGMKFTPVEADWYSLTNETGNVLIDEISAGESGNYYQQLDEVEVFSNVDDLFSWYKKVYLPGVYEIIMDNYLPRLQQEMEDRLDENEGYNPMRESIVRTLREYLTESDPKVGTGKKPKGSDRRLYTDENPKDTVSVKFRTKQDIIDTLNKESFKSKSHARQSQIINLIHQRLRVALERAKDPEVKKRLKTAFEYIETKKEQSKKKTQEMKEGELTEKCWAGYTQKGMKTMFGKRYPNCVKKTKK
jgi:hypothetical protein